jgi:hypothetical protein
VLEAGRQGLLESKVQLSWCLYIGGKVCAVDGSEIGILATILIGKLICGAGRLACGHEDRWPLATNFTIVAWRRSQRTLPRDMRLILIFVLLAV